MILSKGTIGGPDTYNTREGKLSFALEKVAMWTQGVQSLLSMRELA